MEKLEKYQDIIDFEQLISNNNIETFSFILNTSKKETLEILNLLEDNKENIKISTLINKIKNTEITDNNTEWISRELNFERLKKMIDINIIQEEIIKTGELLKDGVSLKEDLEKKVVSNELEILEKQINTSFSKKLFNDEVSSPLNTFILTGDNQTAKEIIIDEIKNDIGYNIIEVNLEYYTRDEEINNLFGTEEEISFLLKEISLNSKSILVFKNIDKVSSLFFDKLEDLRKNKKVFNIDVKEILIFLETEEFPQSRADKEKLLQNKSLFRDLNRRNFISFDKTTSKQLREIGFNFSGKENKTTYNGLNISFEEEFFKYIDLIQAKSKYKQYSNVNNMILSQIIDNYVTPYMKKNNLEIIDLVLDYDLNKNTIIIKNNKEVIFEINIDRKFFIEDLEFRRYSDEVLQKNLDIIEDRIQKKKNINQNDINIINSIEGIFLLDGYQEQKETLIAELSRSLKKDVIEIDMNEITQEADFYKLVGMPLGFEKIQNEEQEKIQEDNEEQEKIQEDNKFFTISKFNNNVKEKEKKRDKYSELEEKYALKLFEYLKENKNVTIIFKGTKVLNPKFQEFLEIIINTGKYALNDGRILDFSQTLLFIDKELDITQEIKKEEIQEYKDKRKEETFTNNSFLINKIKSLDFYSLDLRTIYHNVKTELELKIQEIQEKENIYITYNTNFIIGLIETSFDYKDGLEYLKDDINIFIDESLENVKRNGKLKKGQEIDLNFDLKKSKIFSDTFDLGDTLPVSMHQEKTQVSKKTEIAEINAKRNYLRKIIEENIDYSFSISEEFDNFMEYEKENFIGKANISIEEYMDFKKTNLLKEDLKLFLRYYENLKEFLNKPDIKDFFSFIKDNGNLFSYKEFKLYNILIGEFEIYLNPENIIELLKIDNNLLENILDPSKTNKTIFRIKQFSQNGVILSDEISEILNKNNINIDKESEFISILMKDTKMKDEIIKYKDDFEIYFQFLKFNNYYSSFKYLNFENYKKIYNLNFDFQYSELLNNEDFIQEILAKNFKIQEIIDFYLFIKEKNFSKISLKLFTFLNKYNIEINQKNISKISSKLEVIKNDFDSFPGIKKSIKKKFLLEIIIEEKFVFSTIDKFSDFMEFKGIEKNNENFKLFLKNYLNLNTLFTQKENKEIQEKLTEYFNKNKLYKDSELSYENLFNKLIFDFLKEYNNEIKDTFFDIEDIININNINNKEDFNIQNYFNENKYSNLIEEQLNKFGIHMSKDTIEKYKLNFLKIYDFIEKNKILDTASKSEIDFYFKNVVENSKIIKYNISFLQFYYSDVPLNQTTPNEKYENIQKYINIKEDNELYLADNLYSLLALKRKSSFSSIKEKEIKNILKFKTLFNIENSPFICDNIEKFEKNPSFVSKKIDEFYKILEFYIEFKNKLDAKFNFQFINENLFANIFNKNIFLLKELLNDNIPDTNLFSDKEIKKPSVDKERNEKKAKFFLIDNIDLFIDFNEEKDRKK